ncbi:RNA polymerase-associated protein RapA [compost metagenome]
MLGEDRLAHLAVHRGKAATSVSVSSGIDWLDVEGAVHISDEAVPWPALWEAIAENRRYVRLGSGRMARLPQDWLTAQRPLFEALGLGGKGASEGRARVQRYQAPLVDKLLAGASRAETDPAWQAFSRKLRSFGGIEEAPLPSGFAGELRAYQRQGLNFLSFLRDYGLHGILADDMGLGKTVQAAALLAANHPDEAGPSLVIAPTSVIHNWQAELGRFAPGLKTLLLHGPGRDVSAIDAHDVVITTYTTARLDLEAHLKRTYHTVILDEAQAIKNPKSQTAEVVRALKSRHRLCLTGTPIENNLMELWSQFSFLMPGMLGKEAEFKGRYPWAIAQGDKRAADELKTRIAPFVLRRLKTEVAKDLPPRTDVPVWCELAPAQRRLYDTVLSASRARVMAAVAEKGVNQSQITILDALLKLRQVCCHPGLLGTPETLHLPSAKVDAFLGLVDELVANGHRALVFSQFTSMLAILREQLDEKGVAYEYLDGATKNRQAKVDRFNTGDTPVFLISLKAGGTGLNLTGADYVIHFDPWWNPAVEDQATDRAHRIGQTRQVFNYKLLAKDTVEEKLLALQERKRALVRDVLDADTLGKQLTREDLDFLFGGTATGPVRESRAPKAPTPRPAEKAPPRRALEACMGDTGFIRSADLQTAYGIDRNVATKMLNRLVDAGVLLKEGERRGTRYRPGPAWEGWIESPGAAIGKGHSIP